MQIYLVIFLDSNFLRNLNIGENWKDIIDITYYLLKNSKEKNFFYPKN